MTINNRLTVTERQLVQLAEAQQALRDSPVNAPFDTLHYYVREGYTTAEIVAMVTTNQPVPGKPAEWARNSQRVGA